eukprot:CAMPEP_0195052972 /NCGR_PEP_ID=MMETSP0448-20130528/2256_1 /TAXON_ID=66468 /ORGANISM="Heterocapsa triquestra, Strain CCMP 448" /LENGTH=522 /DNA_ID=CAMNT_0040082209 /DNA_START=83 /DNA_END=1651 /DNA_ORIENTATION=-
MVSSSRGGVALAIGASDPNPQEERSGTRSAGGAWVVRRTFIEMLQTESDTSPLSGGDGGLRVRASSDPTLYKSGKMSQSSFSSPSGEDAASNNVEFELTGLSDTETNPDQEAGNDSLNCYSYMDEETATPLPACAAPASSSRSGAMSRHSADSAAGPSHGGQTRHPAEPDSKGESVAVEQKLVPSENRTSRTLADLLAENARLAKENRLLRESARLASENASLKAGSHPSQASSVAAPAYDLASYTAAAPAAAPEMEAAALHPRVLLDRTASVASGAYGVGAPGAWILPVECAQAAVWQPRLQPHLPVEPAQPSTERSTPSEHLSVSLDELIKEPAMPVAPAPPQDRSSHFEPSPDGEEWTTVMLRNLPNNYSRPKVIEMLDREGFAKRYDFLYLPIDFKTRACLGYAFVNLVSTEDVPRFWNKFNGFSKWALPSKKVCGVTWSGPHQGLQAHMERYRNSPVMHSTVPEHYKPVIFKDGVQTVFPLPTKTPRPPRTRSYAGYTASPGKKDKGKDQSQSRSPA